MSIIGHHGHRVKPWALCPGFFFFWPLRGRRSGVVPLHSLIYVPVDKVVPTLRNTLLMFFYCYLDFLIGDMYLLNVLNPAMLYYFKFISLVCIGNDSVLANRSGVEPPHTFMKPLIKPNCNIFIRGPR